jgi:hypothetical protein
MAAIDNKKKKDVIDEIGYAAGLGTSQSVYGMLYLYGMPENVMVRTLEASLYEVFAMAGDVIMVHAYKLKGKFNGTGWIAFRGTDAS